MTNSELLELLLTEIVEIRKDITEVKSIVKDINYTLQNEIVPSIDIINVIWCLQHPTTFIRRVDTMTEHEKLDLILSKLDTKLDTIETDLKDIRLILENDITSHIDNMLTRLSLLSQYQ